MGGLGTSIKTLNWLLVLLTGTAVAFSTFAFVYLVVYAYVISYPVLGPEAADSGGQLEWVASFVASWGARIFFLMSTTLAASWIVYKIGEAAALHGVLMGAVAATVHQLIVYFLYPPVAFGELLVYSILGILGGWLGGVRGHGALAGQEALYQGSRRIGKARDPHAVAAAIGEHMGGPDLGNVILWQIASRSGNELSGGEHAFRIWASWTLQAEEPRAPEIRLDAERVPALNRLPVRRSAVVRSKELPPSERAAWESQGICTAFLMPLITPDEAWIGLLMVTFRKRRRLSRNVVRGFLTIGAPAALALENLRLVEKAKQAGRETGVLLERQRLSREIHDTLTQGFTSIAMSLTAAELAEASNPGEKESAQWHVKRARRTARENLKEARRLVWALRPESLDRHSLPEAIERLAEEWSEETGIEAHATITGTPCPIVPEAEVALLRAAQEALSNIRQHANASRTALTLSYIDTFVVLDVRDNGVGFDPTRSTATGVGTTIGSPDEGGFGITSVRERVEQFGGTLLIESTPGKGTTLVIELPIAKSAEVSSEESQISDRESRRSKL